MKASSILVIGAGGVAGSIPVSGRKIRVAQVEVYHHRTGCIVNQVDGLIRSQKAAGSNPAIQTKLNSV